VKTYFCRVYVLIKIKPLLGLVWPEWPEQLKPLVCPEWPEWPEQIKPLVCPEWPEWPEQIGMKPPSFFENF
jgi:hypothetical protein